MLSNNEKNELNIKKQIYLKAIAKVAKRLRGKRSQNTVALEYEISNSLISTIERALKDPQSTTIARIAEAHNLKTSKFYELVEKELPEGFSFTDL